MVATNIPAKPGHHDRRAQGRAVVELPTRESIARAQEGGRRAQIARAHRALDRAERQRDELRHVICWRIERALVKHWAKLNFTTS